MSDEESHEIQETRATYSTAGGAARLLPAISASELRALIREVVTETLSELKIQPTPEYPVHPQRTAMKKETAAYKTLHTDLVQNYLGQYVAIYEGNLVDHDADPLMLHQRVQEKYPGKVVLSRKVQREAEPVLHMRSPRLERRP